MSALKKCRLCLKTTEAYLNLFNGNFRQIIQELTLIKISETDGLPKEACIGCIYEIQQASKTRKRILECHRKLVLSIQVNELDLNHREIVNLVAERVEECSSVIDERCEENPVNTLSFDENEQTTEGVLLKEENGEDIHQINIPMDAILLVKEDNTEATYLEFDKRKNTLQNIKFTPTETSQNEYYACNECNEQVPGGNDALENHFLSIHFKSKCYICGTVVPCDKLADHSEIHNSSVIKLCDNCELPVCVCVKHKSSNDHDESGIGSASIIVNESKPPNSKEHIEATSSEIVEHDNNDSGYEPAAKPKLNYSCRYPSCKNGYYSRGPPGFKNKKFFYFPSNPSQLEIWKKACDISPTTNCKNFRVCHEHFQKSDFNNPDDPTRLSFRAVPRPKVVNECLDEHSYTKRFNVFIQ